MAKKKQVGKKLTRQFSAGGAVFRKDDDRILWLVIRPAGKNTWRLAKGLIERGESSLEAAKREVEEEAGIKVEVLGKVGNDKYFYRQGRENIYKIVTYYLMEYEKEGREQISWEIGSLDWFPYEEAREKLSFSGEKEILEKANGLLEKE